MMPQLRVRLFGKLSVCYGERIVQGLEAHKVREMFGYLLLYRNVSHAREGLACLFWGDSTAVQSKKYLRQTLWEIQRTMQQVSRVKGRRGLSSGC